MNMVAYNLRSAACNLQEDYNNLSISIDSLLCKIYTYLKISLMQRVMTMNHGDLFHTYLINIKMLVIHVSEFIW